MTDALTLTGTDEASPAPTRHTVGPLAFEFLDGAIAYVTVDGVELIRRVGFLARDRDWGTLVPEIGPVEESREDGRLTLAFAMRFSNGAATLAVDLRIIATPDGLDVSAKARADGAFETNRTGFTVLHPITGQAGAPVRVTHGDGRVEDGTLPWTIAPWQPFMDIAAIRTEADGIACDCRFEGDVFEMEDQRQWGDASFKTYNRPLALPWPYQIADGEELHQAVRLSFTPAEARRPPAEAMAAPDGVRFPQTAILVTAAQARDALADPMLVEALGRVAPQRLLCHVDATLKDVAAQFAAFAALENAAPDYGYDLELIADFGDDPARDPTGPLTEYAEALRVSGFAPESVMICPAVDRQSTPPGSDWPPCPPLEAIHEAARRLFGAPLMGGGMASFFPELNRKHPPADRLDFVSHSLCPIVHNAGDRAVMETLQAVPHITRSARAIIGTAAYRIGPSTIAMRQNPYGARTIPNPDGRRVPMTDDDPRHRARFGAAYALGLASALAPAGVAVWTPAELLGPRGLFAHDGTRFPLTDVVAALAALAGQEVREARIETGRAHLTCGETRLLANLTPVPQDGLGAYDWRAEKP